jgi:hypothetical protein
MKQLEIFQNLTSLQGESHANLSAWQDSKKARKTLDTSGRACLKSLSTKDPLMLLSKMLVASSMWHSTRCALNWKVKATPQGRLYFQLQASTLPTKEIESGVSERNLWATPQLTDGTRINQKPRAKEDLTEAAKQGGCSNLREQVHEDGSLWPTPRATTRMAYFEQPSPSMIKGTHGWNLNAAVTDAESENPHRMWPTPRAAIGMHMKMSQGLSDLQHKRYLETEVAHEHIEVEKQKPGGHLNADWVEWLMGYGKGYTDLSIDEKLTLKDHQGFYEEPRTSRVTHNQQDKVNRLKSLGNSIVPQIAYNLGLAIIEDYNHGK